jgi:hypothetical protein
MSVRRSCTTIKKHISALVIPPLVVMPPDHLMLHLTHNVIINVEPSFTTSVSTLVKHVDCIVPVACGLTNVVKHPIKLVAHRLCRFLGICHYFWTNRTTKKFSASASTKEKNEKICT